MMLATLPQSNDEYTTQHKLDGTFLASDHGYAKI